MLKNRTRVEKPHRKPGVSFLLFIFVVIAASGCSQRNAAVRVPPAPYPSTQPAEGSPTSTQPNAAPPNTTAANAGRNSRSSPATPGVSAGSYVEQGLASWYGVPYHGRRAADGEIYDMYKLTAAHRTLPFNTVVRVTNLANNEHVDVRITDRGPFVEDRIIDLSLAAARAIDMVAVGTAQVRVEIISVLSNPTAGRFAVQVGAFADRSNAERLRDRLAANYQAVAIENYLGPTGPMFRVRVGSVASEAAARQLAAKVQSDSGLDTFVVRLDDTQQGSAPGGSL